MTGRRRSRRIALYGSAILLAGGLLWGWLGWAPSVPPDVATLVNAAECLETQFGLHEEALENVRRALALDPDHPYAHLLGARASEGLGDWAGALAYYRRAEGLYPDDARRRAIRISSLRPLLAAGDHERLEELARDLLASGEDGTVRFILGVARERRDDPAGALEQYRAAIDGSGHLDAHFRAAVVLERLDLRDDARRVLREGLRQDPARTTGWLMLARLRLESGDEDGAVAALLAGAAVDPLGIRGDLRQNRVWNPLKNKAALATLLAAAPARARE